MIAGMWGDVVGPVHSVNEELLGSLPLPLAQIYLRTGNAKTTIERHNAAYYLWEGALKLLVSVALAECASRRVINSEVRERLAILDRPSAGHWWELLRLLVPILAEDDPPFRQVRDLVLGRGREDMPRAAGLNAALQEELGRGRTAGTAVQLTELFQSLVTYRNRELGHGAAAQRSESHYRRIGTLMAGGIAEILSRVDCMAGRRLLFVSDVRMTPAGSWLVDPFSMTGCNLRRLNPFEISPSDAGSLPRPSMVYAMCPGRADEVVPPETASRLLGLHPLVLLEPDSMEVFFWNQRRDNDHTDHLCYTSGRIANRTDLGEDFRHFLTGVPARSDSLPDAGVQPVAPTLVEPLDDDRGGARRIGEFELLARIGRGGMGVVYRAWQPSLGRQVALKCLIQAGDDRAEARFSREIRALGRVEHPNLVKIFTSGSDGEHWYYAMELVEGADLATVFDGLVGSGTTAIGDEQWQRAVQTACEHVRTREETLSREPVPRKSTRQVSALSLSQVASVQTGRGYVSRVVELMRQVADAAHALHEAGVVHRDIKPGNVIVNPDATHAILMDLGLAQLADEVDGRVTRTRQFVGTLRYASPEQVLAAGRLDRRSDVYSIGATLWELLALRPLYGANQDTSTPELMLRIQTRLPERLRRINPQVPPDLETIVLKCLEKEPGQRYQSANELAEDLARWQRGEPIRAKPPTLGYVLGRFVVRHKLPIAAAALLLLLGLGGTAISYWKLSQARNSLELFREHALAMLMTSEDNVWTLARHLREDRLLLESMVGLAIERSYTLSEDERERRLSGLGGLSLDELVGELGALGVGMYQRNHVNEIDRLSGALDLAESSEKAGLHFQRGNAFRDRGNLRRAIEDYKAAIALGRALGADKGYYHLRLGQALFQDGMLEDAKTALTRAIELDAGAKVRALQERARLFEQMAKGGFDRERIWTMAFADWEEVVAIQGGRDALAYLHFGDALKNHGSAESLRRAFDVYSKAVALDANLVLAHHGLGRVSKSLGYYVDAVAAYEKAIATSPGGDISNSLSNLAFVLASCPDDSLREGLHAVRLAQESLEVRNHSPVFGTDAMAAAYAEAGDFERAIEAQRTVLAHPAFPKTMGKCYRQAARQRLKLYVDRVPFREDFLLPCL